MNENNNTKWEVKETMIITLFCCLIFLAPNDFSNHWTDGESHKKRTIVANTWVVYFIISVKILYLERMIKDDKTNKS